MPSGLTENDWKLLLQRIFNGACAPFLGAGACYGILPLGAEIAREWATTYHYPFNDDDDLVRVAQFVAVNNDRAWPKDEVIRRFATLAPPDFAQPDEPHGVLAELGLPIYLTTNYDDFMVRALKARYKDPKREMCRWNEMLKDTPSVFDGHPAYQPTRANPLVFHLHGHSVAESLVLTEDDYFRFLARMVFNVDDLLPAPVRTALSSSALLFIGYRLADWNLRVLMQGLRPQANRTSYMVLVPPQGPAKVRKKAQKYLEQYYGAMDIRVFWGTAREFCGQLGPRWAEFKKGQKGTS
jgi:SIR2-like domain